MVGYSALPPHLLRLRVSSLCLSTACVYQQAKATAEIEFPASGQTPDKEVVKRSLEEAAGILKGANATAEQLSGFVEKAQKIAIWGGLGATWASTFFGN